MKVTQIVSSLAARHGGPSRSVRGLAEGLARRGHTVELLTTGSVEEAAVEVASSLSLHVYARRWPQSLARSPLLELHLWSHAADIIHHHGLWQRPLHYASETSKRTGVPLVISPRGMMCDWAWNHHRFKKQLAAWFVHPGSFVSAAGWHATSEEEAADIRRRGFTQPICLAPNGVITPSPDELKAEARYWHEHLPPLARHRVALFSNQSYRRLWHQLQFLLHDF